MSIILLSSILTMNKTNIQYSQITQNRIKSNGDQRFFFSMRLSGLKKQMKSFTGNLRTNIHLELTKWGIYIYF